ncbi:hypothetical protein BD626DRAFT_550359 [Schizophyllum amplum]|uniref:Uncharacterized protein n=1 Tax=Schizophyllum amplum TaxID=97359 RepID=A0A550C3C2_9AGAR|nr:hypothetical protein BD626DRAFT_550359 [Auriculariopsis ampla]
MSECSSSREVVIALQTIPRLKLRRKTAVRTLDPLLKRSHDDGRRIISSASNLSGQISSWISGLDVDSQQAELACRRAVEALEDILASCAGSIQSSLSQRQFNEMFPRLARMSGPLPADWEAGAAVIKSALEVHTYLGGISKASMPSIGTQAINSSADLSYAIPAVIASLQTNVALDETLAFLLRTLNQPEVDLDPHPLLALSVFLPTLASMHPDPSTRHISFRILSLLLSAAPSSDRLDILNALATDLSLPQMTVASISLRLGQAVLQTNPPDVLTNTTKEAFMESSEPRRLTEVLSLLYVLLRRDVENKTGIRDADTLRAMEANIMAPLRAKLDEWMDGASDGHVHDLMPLVSLSINVERVDTALEELRGEAAA